MDAKVFAQASESDGLPSAYEQLKMALGPGWLPGLTAATGLSANGLKSMLRAGDVNHPKWVHVTEWLEKRLAARMRATEVLADIIKNAA